MPVASCSSSTVAPARNRLLHHGDPAVGRALRPPASQRVDVARLAGPVERPTPFCSSERSAFCSASVKLRPIAIASPTLFIVVVSVGSAAGNFSNANRGTLTTT